MSEGGTGWLVLRSKFAWHYGLWDGGVVHVGLGGSTQERGEVASSLVFRGKWEGAGSAIFTVSLLIVIILLTII